MLWPTSTASLNTGTASVILNRWHLSKKTSLPATSSTGVRIWGHLDAVESLGHPVTNHAPLVAVGVDMKTSSKISSTGEGVTNHISKCHPNLNQK